MRAAASNNGMHPTADTLPVIIAKGAGRRVMPGVRRRDGAQAQGSAERGSRVTYHAAGGWLRNLGAA